ncbi:MAG TPA: PDZ domain-containing protein [Tissierellia bacterium]|jgi:serine protease Do|nr:PDZ domain-containing protein [Tissierellia bacterium]
MKKFLGVVLVLLLMSIITGVVFAFVFDSLQSADVPAPTVAEPTPTTVTQTRIVFEERSIADVVQSVKDSVVIVRKEVVNFNESRFVGAGSGVVYREDDEAYYVITNAHVVNGGNKFNIGFTELQQYPAELLGFDNDADIATLKILKSDITNGEKLVVAKLGNPKDLFVGETVLAVGNALGYGQSVTKGIVSAVDRDLGGRKNAAYRLIQTDAAINPGNSGGALVNAAGEVVGINTVKIASTEVEGVGFAIPISAGEHIAEAIREKGYFPRSFLGVTVRNLDLNALLQNNYPLGVYVQQVVPNGPAAKAGIQSGDLILKIGDTEVTDSADLVYEITSRSVGEVVPITIYRDSVTMEVQATLESNENYRGQ